jgi:hypothetical protein
MTEPIDIVALALAGRLEDADPAMLKDFKGIVRRRLNARAISMKELLGITDEAARADDQGARDLLLDRLHSSMERLDKALADASVPNPPPEHHHPTRQERLAAALERADRANRFQTNVLRLQARKKPFKP